MIDLSVINPFLETGVLILTLGAEILGIIALITWILTQYDFHRQVKEIIANSAKVAVPIEVEPVKDDKMTSEVKVTFDKKATKKAPKVIAKPKVRGMDD